MDGQTNNNINRLVLGLLAALCTTVHHLRWLFPLALAFVLYTYELKFFPLLMFLAFGSLFFYVIALPFLMHLSCFIQLTITPIDWGHAKVTYRMVKMQKPTILSLLLSNPIEFFIFSFLAGIILLRHTVFSSYESPVKEPLFIFLIVLLGSLIRSLLMLWQSHAKSQISIALFRSFREKHSYYIKSGLIPVLSSYGCVNTLTDTSLENVQIINSEDVPVGNPEILEPLSKDWKNTVTNLLDKSDIAVIDISRPSDPIGWEICMCIDNPHISAIVLVGSIDSLILNRSSMYSSIERVMKPYVKGKSSKQLLSSLGPPLAYSTDLSNIVFSWQLYRLMRMLSTQKQKLCS